MSFSVSYSLITVPITPPPRFDAILSEKSGRGYFRGIKASAEESVLFLIFEYTDLKFNLQKNSYF